MSGRSVLIALAFVLVLAPSAVAKGVQDATVCGADGCTTAPLNGDTYLVFEGGPPTAAPTERAPFYELRYGTMPHDGPRVDEVVRVRTLYVPSAGLLRGEDGTWMRADSRAGEAMRRALADVRPFPASRLDLPGVPEETARPAPGGGDGPPIVPLLGLTLLAGAAALALGSRRRRRPAAG